MCRWIVAVVGVLALLALDGQMPHGIGADPLMAVELSSDRQVYLLGEPVNLDVIVRNVSDETLVSTPVFVKDLSPEISTLISNEGRTYCEYRIGLYANVLTIAAFMDVLAPGEERGYPLRVLYTYERPSRLALEEPGSYFLKVRYRVQISKPSPQIAEFESNTIRIQVRKPSGFDAKVWEALDTKQFAQFLHAGQVAPGFPEVLGKAIDIVRRFPNSSYSDALRDALREYYRFHERNREWKKSLRTRDELRELLEIDDSLFPDDQRLDLEIMYNFPKETSFKQVVAAFSQRTGVPLSLAPEVRGRAIRHLIVDDAFVRPGQDVALRGFMRSQANYGFVWVRRGDGYELTTEDKAYALRLREAGTQRAAAKQQQ